MSPPYQRRRSSSRADEPSAVSFPNPPRAPAQSGTTPAAGARPPLLMARRGSGKRARHEWEGPASLCAPMPTRAFTQGATRGAKPSSAALRSAARGERAAALAAPVANVPENPAPCAVAPRLSTCAPWKSGLPPPHAATNSAAAAGAAVSRTRPSLLPKAGRVIVRGGALLEVGIVGMQLERSFDEDRLGFGSVRVWKATLH